jgi:Kef-type K+ transport system membrane component KefB
MAWVVVAPAGHMSASTTPLDATPLMRYQPRPMRFPRILTAMSSSLALTAALAAPAFAADAGHGADFLRVLEALAVVLIGARLGGALFERFGQSPVLGELLAGIVIGNLGIVGFTGLVGLRDLPGIDLLAQVGVLFLLFKVGLETDIAKMMAVGGSSFIVAVLGVIAPMVLGFFCSRGFFPAHDPLTHWFVGATLCATSVGITARVLADLGRTTSTEGRIILGAAVIDDVLGLMVLAVVGGVIEAANRGEAFDPRTLGWIVAKATFFLGLAIGVGRWVSRRLFGFASRLAGEGALLSVALALCFALSWLSGKVGLAPIVGAFAAGLIVEEPHYRGLVARDHKGRTLPELLEPIASFLVPVFFVLMGMRVDLTVFGAPGVLGFAAALTAAAVVGKQVCSLGVLERGADRIAVGLGMIPRGEVGLIFAGIGAALMLRGERVIDDAVFSAVVIMVALTTLVTPPLLVWRMRGSKRA